MEILTYKFDDSLIESVRTKRKPETAIYRLGEPIVVLGRGSKVKAEIEVEAILADGIPVYRRYGGGCSVVIDPGNIVISAALPVRGFGKNRLYFGLLSGWQAEGLSRLGYKGIEPQGISDLAVSGRKISGSCIYNGLDFLYYSSTLLVEPDLELMEKYLKHPPREPEYRQGRKHSDFIAGLMEFRGDIDTAELLERLRNTLRAEDIGSEAIMVNNEQKRVKGSG